MITKRQALEEGIELWTILAKTGEKYKRNIPGPWSEYVSMCPCCEYAEEECERCPVVWSEDGYLNSGCYVYGSPYPAWEKAKTVESRKIFAQEVADLHRKALDLL